MVLCFSVLNRNLDTCRSDLLSPGADEDGRRGQAVPLQGSEGQGGPALLGTLWAWGVGPKRKLCRHYDEPQPCVFKSHAGAPSPQSCYVFFIYSGYFHMGELSLICFGSRFCFEIGLLLKGKDWFFFSFLLSSGAGALPSLERNSVTTDRPHVGEPLLLPVSESELWELLSRGCGVGPIASLLLAGRSEHSRPPDGLRLCRAPCPPASGTGS